MQVNSSLPALATLQDVLEKLRDAGGFRVVVLTSTEGLPLASVFSEQDSTITAAMAALLQRVSREAKEELGMDPLDEVMLRTETQTRLVSRYFTCGERRLILALLVPKGHAYRRLTNNTIREIQALLA